MLATLLLGSSTSLSARRMTGSPAGRSMNLSSDSQTMHRWLFKKSGTGRASLRQSTWDHSAPSKSSTAFGQTISTPCENRFPPARVAPCFSLLRTTSTWWKPSLSTNLTSWDTLCRRTWSTWWKTRTHFWLTFSGFTKSSGEPRAAARSESTSSSCKTYSKITQLEEGLTWRARLQTVPWLKKGSLLKTFTKPCL